MQKRKATTRLRLRPSFIQFSSQRNNSLLPDIRSDGPDLFKANHTVAINQIAFRGTVNSVIYSDPRICIRGAQYIGVAKFTEPGQRVFALVSIIQTIDRHSSRARILEQQGMLVSAGDAPG